MQAGVRLAAVAFAAVCVLAVNRLVARFSGDGSLEALEMLAIALSVFATLITMVWAGAAFGEEPEL